MRSEDAVKADVHDLWKAVYGEPPAVAAPAETLLDLLVQSLPLPSYETIHRHGVVSPFPTR